jgi:cell division protein FtsZ
MVQAGLNDVEFIVANTDQQALRQNPAPVKLQIGMNLTKGLGAGADPNIGREAALEDTDKILESLTGADLVFVTTGLGGGTGTGAAPVIASLANQLGALTVAVVTKPFRFEGKKRATHAETGLRDLAASVDSIITIPNERLLASVDKATRLSAAFELADDVLRQAIQGISDLILVPGIINLDFADVKAIMSRAGLAIMGTGIASGENRAALAATAAVSSPLLEDANVEGAKGVIINVTGGPDLALTEAIEASEIVSNAAHEDANIIFGAVMDPRFEGQIKVTVIATGFDRARSSSRVPSLMSDMNAVADEVPAYRADQIGKLPDTPTDHELFRHAVAQSAAQAAERRAIPVSQNRVLMVRRPSIDLRATAAAMSDPVDAESPLDVPAFLRRHEG